MLKKTITYTDYDGNQRTEDLYFNMSKAELMELEMSTPGGFAEMCQRAMAKQDAPALMKIFKDLIVKSYGEKSADGKRFAKTDVNGNSLADEFLQTEAYSVLFMELFSSTEAATEFFTGVIPADVADAAQKQLTEKK